MTLAENLAVIESAVSELKGQRNIGPLQNDVYEAIDDLCHLGRRAVVGDTRVNFPVRAGSDLDLCRKLHGIVSGKAEEDRERYLPLLDCAENLLRQIAQLPIPKDGHLGVLGVIRCRFDFLFNDYGFTIVDEQPTKMRLTSELVVIVLGWATQSSLSFSLSRGGRGDFWIEDLLYLHGDQRYRSVPQAIQLNTESEVDEWFQFIASVLRQFADELLRGEVQAFDRLAEAQAKRDAEYAATMNEKYGLK